MLQSGNTIDSQSNLGHAAKRYIFGNPYLLLIFATLGWGGNAVAGRMAAGEWQPFTLTCLRWLLVAIILLPFAITPIKQDWQKVKKAAPVLLLYGSVGMAMFNLLMYLALNYTSAINVSIEQASMPVMIMLANFFLLSQRVRALQIIGVIVSIAGVAITATQGDPLSFFSQGLNRGDAWMLLACVFYAGYTFFLKWRPDVDWVVFLLVVAIGAFLMSLPFSLYEFYTVEQTMPGTADIVLLLYVIIVPSIVSQVCFAKGVALIGGNRAGLFINLVPVFGSFLAVLILGEQFKPYHGLGLVMVIGGIMLAERAKS